MNTANSIHGTRHGTVALLLGALALGIAALPAIADSDIDQVVVRFRDLDPSTPGDAALLYRRIHSAANTVCWHLDLGDLASRMRMQDCIQRATAEAVTRINRPALIAVYNARNRPPLPTAATVGQVR
jgi:UrcA family protein